MSDETDKRKRNEFDDALRGYYQDHDEVRPDELTDYKSLTAETVGSLILGILSILTFISVLFLIFPLMGMILGIIAIRKILNAPEVLSGLGIASAGVAISFIAAISGLYYQYYISSYEIPIGYREINFEFLAEDPRTGQINPEVLLLAESTQQNASRIFIEGFMQPTRNINNVTEFLIGATPERSKFAPPKPTKTEFIRVRLTGGLTTSYQSSLIGVGGILRVDTTPEPGELIYRIDADFIR
ncbi:MAG: DUF4190 domain-containing protein [Planctomycetaceae bacterium]|jgi:hypothetical protein|nr:DUF4190 domain-containing protein [Planctomycetaceae bacterium]